MPWKKIQRKSKREISRLRVLRRHGGGEKRGNKKGKSK